MCIKIRPGRRGGQTLTNTHHQQEEAGGSSMASELNLSNVGGVFVVLMGGMGLALVVAIGEFLLECWDIAKEDQVSGEGQYVVNEMGVKIWTKLE